MRAVLLLSGGLDSYAAGAVAREHGCTLHALSFDYGQVNRPELDAAVRTAEAHQARDHHVMRLDLGLGAFGKSALLQPAPGAIGDERPFGAYVPARNTIFLACALGYAEVVAAQAIVVGVSVIDYPRRGGTAAFRDCHPEYLLSFQRLARLATRVEAAVDLYAPLLYLNKKEIVAYSLRRGLNHGLTWSCYGPGPRHCGRCKACELRLYAFHCLGREDPAPYEGGFTLWVEAYRERWREFLEW